MEKLEFDLGVKEYRVNGGGVLRFNPSDPNLYARFFEAQEKVRDVEKRMTDEGGKLTGEDAGREAVRLMSEADREVKAVLGWVFGGENDFDAVLGGVNIMAVSGNGERVVTNLFAALAPVIREGAEACAGQKLDAAKANRAARRAGR